VGGNREKKGDLPALDYPLNACASSEVQGSGPSAGVTTSRGDRCTAMGVSLGGLVTSSCTNLGIFCHALLVDSRKLAQLLHEVKHGLKWIVCPPGAGGFDITTIVGRPEQRAPGD
jgi:hypothetical protein